MLRSSVLLLLLFLPAVCSAQEGPVTDVPALVKKPFYKEFTNFTGNNIFTHIVSYNEPHVVDEEFSYTFQFTIDGFENIQPQHVIDLAKDTGIVHCTFGVLSAWNWDNDAKAVFSGTIKIISKTKQAVVLEEDVRIREGDGKILIYKGQKTFVRKKEK